MEKKDIIENGLLEAYLLGELTAGENAAVERALSGDSALREQYAAMEKDLEAVAGENAITPSFLVKERLFRELELKSSAGSASVEVPKFNPSIYLAVAASLALLFMLGSIWLYLRLDKLNNTLEVVDNQLQELNTDNQRLQVEIGALEEELAVLKDEATQKYIMKGNALMPGGYAITYVNHRDKKVVLDRSGLPALPEGKTYQLWGDVEGHMIDMGVIPRENGMANMAYLDNAESLNITIEPEGGSDQPTVSQLVTNILIESTPAP